MDNRTSAICGVPHLRSAGLAGASRNYGLGSCTDPQVRTLGGDVGGSWPQTRRLVRCISGFGGGEISVVYRRAAYIPVSRGQGSDSRKDHENMGFHPFQIDSAQVERGRREFQEYGFVTFEATFSPDFYGALLLEARKQRVRACWEDRLVDRSGTVLKNSIRGLLDRCAGLLMMAPGTLALMEQITGESLVPSWDASCYTYYERAGALLSRHVDKPDSCRATILVGLESVWPPQDEVPPGNHVRLFTGDESSARVVDIATLPNRVLILNGKSVPHERPVLGKGQRVTILSGCFRSIASQ